MLTYNLNILTLIVSIQEESIMHTLLSFNLLVAGILFYTSVYAGEIQVEDAWSRATAPGQEVASVDLTITSKQHARLIAVSSKVSKIGELHRMVMADGMMKMREVTAIDLPAGKHVKLGESGYHLMLVGLESPLKVGEKIPLTLTIKLDNKHIEKVNVIAEVKSLTATKAMHEDEHNHRH